MSTPVAQDLERLQRLLNLLSPQVQTLKDFLVQSAVFLTELFSPYGLQQLAVYERGPQHFVLLHASNGEAPASLPLDVTPGPYQGGQVFLLQPREGRCWGALWASLNALPPKLQEQFVQAVHVLTHWVQLKAEAQQLHLLREVYYSMSDAVVIFDRNSRVRDANPAAERLFEYTVEEMRQLTSAELFPVSWVHVRHIGRSLLTQGHWHGVMPIRTKKGEEKLTEARVSLLSDRHGPLPIVAVLRDLTERERLRTEAARQRLLLEHLLEVARASLSAPLTPREMFEQTVRLARELTGATHIGLMLLDKEGDVGSFWVVGEGSQHLSHEWLTQLVREGLHSGIVGRALQRRKVYTIKDVSRLPGWREWSHIFPWKSVVILPLYYGITPLGVLMVGHKRPKAFSPEDIELLEGTAELLSLALRQARLYEEQIQIAQKRLRAQEEAERYRRQTERFLALVSHEMRTPLQAILGYLEWVRLGYDPDTPLREVEDELRSAEQAAKALLQLINQLLDYQKSKVEPEVVAESFVVADLLRQMEELISPLMSQNMNRFTWEVEPQDLQMWSDRSKLAHILLNLLSNAAKFTRNGQVTLRARLVVEENTPWVVFQVQDTGIGIPSHALKHIFEPFTQADESISHRFGGSGLGLAMVRDYSRLLGGDVSVESQEGVGSTFTVRLPQYLPAASAA